MDRSTLKARLVEARAEGFLFALVLRDGFDGNEYVTRVSSESALRERLDARGSDGGFGSCEDRVIEVYDLRKDLDEQMGVSSRTRSWSVPWRV